ncbi:MAG: hypothetical protein JW809_03785 [Pirellulales bacterium]|nr:hypothetical protein [Pirellulales bacterium]
MKRLGMFLVLLSVSMFALGCSGDAKKKTEEKKTGDTGAAAPADPGTPPAGETK